MRLFSGRLAFYALGLLHVFLVIVWVIGSGYKVTMDGKDYMHIADELASLRFSFDPAVNCNRLPGYPLFLAVLKPFTRHHPMLIAIFQSVVFFVSLVYFLNQIQKKYQLPGLPIFLSATLLVIHPDSLFGSSAVLTEVLVASLLLFILGGLLDPKPRRGLMVGAMALMVITKAEYLLVLGIIMIYLLYMRRKELILGSLLLIAALFTLNLVKNLKLYGVPRPTNFNAGTVIYGGNNLNLDGSWHPGHFTKNYLPPHYALLLDSLRKTQTPARCCVMRDSLLLRAAIEAWQIDPFAQLKVIPLKFVKLWLWPGMLNNLYNWQKNIRRGIAFSYFVQFIFNRGDVPSKAPWPIYVAIVGVYWLSLFVSLMGIYFKVKKRGIDKVDAVFLGILGVVSIMYSTIFHPESRFHVPVMPILLYYSVYLFESYENRIRALLFPFSKLT